MSNVLALFTKKTPIYLNFIPCNYYYMHEFVLQFKCTKSYNNRSTIDN